MVNTFGTTVNQGGYITKFSAGVPVATGYSSTLGAPSTGYFSNWNVERGSLTMTTGAITTAGTYIYNSEVSGSGLLQHPLIANKGTNTIYFGTNNTRMAVANGTPLDSGESYVIEDDIRILWAITASATGLLSVHASYQYNQNMV